VRTTTIDPRAQPIGIERPVQFAPGIFIAQHRHALAVARLQIRIVVDEDAGKIRHARLREHVDGKVAQAAVVALEKHQTHVQQLRHSGQGLAGIQGAGCHKKAAG